MKYNLTITNDIFKDEKSGREIKFTRLALDLGYKTIKITTDSGDICAILDITERALKTNYPYDGIERVVGCLNIDPKESK